MLKNVKALLRAFLGGVVAGFCVLAAYKGAVEATALGYTIAAVAAVIFHNILTEKK
jgi:hypothetical protein